MARGDRREAIVRDDGDRRTFVRTLGEAAERTGVRVDGWVLMDNDYNPLMETPEANLSAGMAEMMQSQTTMKLDCVSEKLGMGDRSSCCRTIRKTREGLPRQEAWAEMWRRIETLARNHA